MFTLFSIQSFRFFECFPLEGIIVLGSDSTTKYIQDCKINCKRNCKGICRNAGRRIRIYSNYVNKYYDELKKKYKFFGGVKIGEYGLLLTPYERFKQYDAVLAFLK